MTIAVIIVCTVFAIISAWRMAYIIDRNNKLRHDALVGLLSDTVNALRCPLASEVERISRLERRADESDTKIIGVENQSALVTSRTKETSEQVAGMSRRLEGDAMRFPLSARA